MDSLGPPGIDAVMLPYWFLFLIFAIGAFRYAGTRPLAPEQVVAPPGVRQADSREHMLVAASLIPALMIGLRYDVGTDFGAYADMFDEIGRLGLIGGFRRIDPGYAFVNWLVNTAGIGFWLVNLICGLLFMWGLVRFARQQPQPWLAIAVAVPYLIIVVGMGYSRQAVAIGLSMAGLAALSRGSFARFVLWVLAGAFFHRTAVILIPIVAIAYSRNRLQAVVIGLIGCVIGYAALGGGDAIEHFQRGYITHSRESEGAGIRLAMNLPPALIFLAFARRFTNEPSELRTWLVFAIIAIVSFVVWVSTRSTTALDRMALYIIPLQILVFARLPTVLGAKERSSGPICAAVLAYSALVQFVWLNFSINAIHWVPYKLYWLS